jgi:hypothetical protein
MESEAGTLSHNVIQRWDCYNDEQMGGDSVEQSEGFKGITGHGCSVCEGQTYMDW